MRKGSEFDFLGASCRDVRFPADGRCFLSHRWNFSMYVDLFVDFSTLCHQPAYSLIVQCQFWTAGVSRVCFRSDGKAPACSFFLVLQMVPRVLHMPTPGRHFHWAAFMDPLIFRVFFDSIYLFFQTNFSFHWIVFFFHYWSISTKLRCLTWLKPWLGCSVQSLGQLSKC